MMIPPFPLSGQLARYASCNTPEDSRCEGSVVPAALLSSGLLIGCCGRGMAGIVHLRRGLSFLRLTAISLQR